MARSAQPNLTHRPKDFATLEQASYLAGQAAEERGKIIEAKLARALQRLRRELAPWYVKLWRRWTGR